MTHRSMESRLLTLGLLGLLLVTLLGIVVKTMPQQEEFTGYTVTLESDGDAFWVIEHKFPISSDEEEQGFREYIRSLGESSEELEALFRETIEEILSEASRVTGREMGVSGLEVNVSITQTITGRLGVLTVSFLWTGFGRVEGGELVVGDVFQGGLYLFEGDTLTFRIPEGSQISRVSPNPDREEGRDISWRGRRSFSSGEPALRISLAAGGSGSEPRGPLPTLTEGSLLVAVIAASGAVVAAALISWRRRSGRGEWMGDVGLILSILRRSGGAVPQSRIVEETGFSKSKVSLLLSLMEERGLVERVKVGRENLVRLVRR